MALFETLLHFLTHFTALQDDEGFDAYVIELDDAYFGAPRSNGKRGSGTDKTSALAAVSLTEQGHPRFLKMQVSQLDTESVSTVTQQIIPPGSEIHSDALGSFRSALRGAYVHHYQVFDKGSGALRWVHTLISNVKVFLLGTYHGLGKKPLQSYFDEFAFRFNRRFWPDQLFPRLVWAVAASDILGYGDLMR